MGESGRAFLHDAANLFGLCCFRQIIKIHGLLNGPQQTAGSEIFKQKAVAAVLGHIQMRNCILYASGIAGHRQGSIDRRDHLGQTAGLKTRWHEDEVASRISLVLQMKIKIVYGHPFMKSV